jgi:hypothetical protein
MVLRVSLSCCFLSIWLTYTKSTVLETARWQNLSWMGRVRMWRMHCALVGLGADGSQVHLEGPLQVSTSGLGGRNGRRILVGGESFFSLCDDLAELRFRYDRTETHKRVLTQKIVPCVRNLKSRSQYRSSKLSVYQLPLYYTYIHRLVFIVTSTQRYKKRHCTTSTRTT